MKIINKIGALTSKGYVFGSRPLGIKKNKLI
jgi:hypothetical protein